MSGDQLYQRLGEVAFTEFAKSAYANQVLSHCPQLKRVLAQPVVRRTLTRMVSQFSMGQLISAGFSYGDIAYVLNEHLLESSNKSVKKSIAQNPILKGSVHSFVQHMPYLAEKKSRAPTSYSFASAARVAGKNAASFGEQLISEPKSSGREYYSMDDSSRARAVRYDIEYPGSTRSLTQLEHVFLADIAGVPKQDIAAQTGISLCGVYQIIRRSYPGRGVNQTSLTPQQKEYIASHSEFTASKIARKFGVSHHVVDRYAQLNGIELLKQRKPLTLEQRAFISEHKHLSAPQIARVLQVKSYMVRNYAKREGIALYVPVLPDPRVMAATLNKAGITAGTVR